MWSVSSRRRLSSSARVSQRRERPPRLGSAPIGKKPLVASTTSSRRPFSALPTIRSFSPSLYMSAVSQKFTPASSAVCSIRTPSSWSGLPHLPSIIAPNAYSLTEMPVPPRIRRFMGSTLMANKAPGQVTLNLAPPVPGGKRRAGDTGGMSDAAELGAFLKARRAALDPADLGLPPGITQRRVKGLRREELAQLSGISVDYYTRLEQGRAKNVSDAVL